MSYSRIPSCLLRLLQEGKTTTAARPAGDAREKATATSRAPSATVLASAGDIMPLLTLVAGDI